MHAARFLAPALGAKKWQREGTGHRAFYVLRSEFACGMPGASVGCVQSGQGLALSRRGASVGQMDPGRGLHRGGRAGGWGAGICRSPFLTVC